MFLKELRILDLEQTKGTSLGKKMLESVCFYW